MRLNNDKATKAEEWPIAIISLLVLLLGLFPFALNKELLKEIELFISHNMVWLTFCLIIFIFNAYFLSVMIKRSLFLKGQGKRLEKLTGRKNKTNRNIKIFIASAMSSTTVAYSLITMFPISFSQGGIYGLKSFISLCIISNTSLIMTLIIYRLTNLLLRLFNKAKKIVLPDIPEIKNGIILGTQGELTK